MAFYLIGLGLNENSITAEALDKIKKSDEVYLEEYTVDFPYLKDSLEKNLNKKIISLNREKVESENFLKNSKIKNISLLVYGDSLSATTHIQLILSCKKQKIDYKIFHNASILTAVSETGLQLYKFGKTTSMPNWKEHTNKPNSFVKYIEENLKINAHTLILIDIGLTPENALNQLEESSKLNKIIIHSNAGTKNSKIYYGSIENLKKISKKIKMPFCIMIPSELHFFEKEALEILSEKLF